VVDVQAIRESFTAFCFWLNLQLFDHQAEDFGEAGRRVDGRFVHRLAGISWPRGDGKTEASACFGLWRFVCGRPGTDVLSVALDLDGADVMMNYARRLVRDHPELASLITVRASALLIEETGSRWTIASREHTASRGRHPDLVLYDECGWARDDELFASLLAGQASVDDPLMLVVSTVGRRKSGPLWTVKQLAEGGDPAVLWRWHGENRSPKVTKAFLERQRRILMPAQYAREHQNLWVDGADALTTSADVDAAMDQPPVFVPRQTEACLFVDLGTVHDPSVIAVGVRLGSLCVITELLTFQGSREQPVQIADVERTVRELATVWNLRKIRIESWQGAQAAQSLARIGLPVELYAPTAKKHAEEWPLLVQQLSARTLVLPKHARLREELLNLVVEIGPQGVRVSDRGKVHQDHAVAVRGVIAMLLDRRCQLTDAESEELWRINFDESNVNELSLKGIL
jgi:hypothetical protein